MVAQAAGQQIQQLRVRRRLAPHPEIASGTYQPFPEQAHPDLVGEYPGGDGVFRGSEPPRQVQPVGRPWLARQQRGKHSWSPWRNLLARGKKLTPMKNAGLSRPLSLGEHPRIHHRWSRARRFKRFERAAGRVGVCIEVGKPVHDRLPLFVGPFFQAHGDQPLNLRRHEALGGLSDER